MLSARSRQDLITEVLDILLISQTGQDPEPEDVEKVDRKIDGILSRLSRRCVVDVQDANAIDDEYLRPLAVIVAGSCDFGAVPDSNSVLYQESVLREMQREPASNAPVRACYF